MTLKELKKFAGENNIDLKGLTLKGDIIERINDEQ